jgi:VanZ family protein
MDYLEEIMRTIYNILTTSSMRWLIALSWMLVLTILLLQPIENQVIPTGVRPAPPSFTRELFFSTIHAIIFSFTAIVWTWTLSQHFSIRTAMWMAVIMLVIYGIGTESAQALTPGRSSQAIDIVANVIGATSGAWILYRWLASAIKRLTPQVHALS